MFNKLLKNLRTIDIKTTESSFHLTEMSAIERGEDCTDCVASGFYGVLFKKYKGCFV